MPAKAGIPVIPVLKKIAKSDGYWIPAFAGMTFGNSWMPGTSQGMTVFIDPEAGQ